MKKIVVRISEGLGNQLFMYANAYALSKKIGYELFIDDISAYKKINLRSYLLDNFNLSSKKAKSEDIQDNFTKYFVHKINKKVDLFRNKKVFLQEKKGKNKSTKFIDYTKYSFSNKIFVEGHFESEKFFIDFKNDIIEQFSLKNFNFKNLFLDPNEMLKKNSISIAIRRNRFSEKSKDSFSKTKSEIFEKNTLAYIFKSINFFKSKVSNPHFFIFSDDVNDLEQLFSNTNNCTVVKHIDNKIFNDFYLSSLCKHFIVGPSTFHWWTAYLSKSSSKICIRPPEELNFSSNIDIYPKQWIKLN